ncbi:MAG: hypothetical protein EPO01_05485 [Aquabacterium sp.]|nr:MAG: hypothetical protein EPO01_05485 [Aquabacterium sp.]
MSSPEMPLIGALVLAIALTANFLVAFWRMDLNVTRARPQQHQARARTPRRQLIACAVSAALPLLGALSMLAVAGHDWTGADAPLLAAACAAVGWLLQSLMDSLMSWGTPRLRA